MAELTVEQRFMLLEQRVAELERQRAVQEERDIALLARIDNFIDDLHRIERVQMRAFDTQTAQFKDIENAILTMNETVSILANSVRSHKQGIETLGEVVLDHKNGIESLATAENENRDAIRSLAEQIATLAAGQQQIITLITGGKPPRND